MGQEVSSEQGATSASQSSRKNEAVKASVASTGVLPLDEAANAGWVTNMLEAVWPYVSPAIRLILEEDLIPMLPKQAAKYCRINSFSLGECHPRVQPLKAYNAETPSTGKRELRLDVKLDYTADVDIVLDVGVCTLGVSRVEFSGELSIIAKPLMQEIPLAGGIQFFFSSEPHVNLLFKEAAVIAEIPIIKSTLIQAFTDLVRREIVAPHSAAAVLNPDLPLELCDPVWLRTVEPMGIACVQLLEGSGLCRWTCRRPGAPLTPEHSDLRIVIRSFGAEWHSALLEYCDGDPQWELTDQKSMACMLIASNQQIITIDAHDDSRLCGPEDRHLAGRALTMPELAGDTASARGKEGTGEWITLDSSTTGTLDGLEPPSLPRLKVLSTWSKLGHLLEQHGDIAKAVENSATQCIGALAVRVGGVERGSIQGSVVVAIRVDAGPASVSRVSEPKSWCPAPRLRLPPREQRVVARLHAKGWDAEEIAALIERPTEVVRREVDPNFAAEQDDVAEKVSSMAHHIMDVLWLPVLRAPAGEEGSQLIHFEARDQGGSAVASATMDLRAAVGWPPLKCLHLKLAKPSSDQDYMALQLVLRFRPCLGRSEDM